MSDLDLEEASTAMYGTRIELKQPRAKSGGDPFAASPELVAGPARTEIKGVLTGTLIGFRDPAQTPMVLYPGQIGSAAIVATSTVDLHGAHVGRRVALMFENGDPKRPMIIGLMRHTQDCPLPESPGNVEIDADGERLIVTAREQLVLRCGKASITLTKSGKVLIEGEYLSSRSCGVHRIRGGSVQIN
jgi:hypothetical protein